MNSISFNGTVEYLRAGAQTLAVANNSGASPNTYTNLRLSGTSTKTLGLNTTVNGTLTRAGTASFSAGAFTLTYGSSATLMYAGSSSQTTGPELLSTVPNLTIANAGTAPTNIVTLASSATVSNALNVSQGVFDQGATFNLTTGAVTVSSGATFRNLGTGDLTLSDNVSNSGTMTLNANGTSCGDADDILIRSSVPGTQRSWSGTGMFSLTDVDVKDQAGTAPIIVRNGTDAGNNGANWTFFATCTAGQTFTWSPAIGMTDWQVPTNWTPTRLSAALPTTDDILLIDGGLTPAPTITNVPTQTIGTLRLVGTVAAMLSTSAANTLTINGGRTADLDVPTNAMLTLQGVSPLRVALASGSTGVIAGSMLVQDGAHRLIGNAANVVTFQNGAFFTTASGFTGNPFGTGATGDGATNSIIFNGGSFYFHNAGESPFGTPANGPVAVFQTGSEADWLTSNGFQASGRTYANLVIGNSGTAVSVSDSGTGNFQFDNLTVNSTSNGNSSLSYNGGGASTVTIQGDITSTGAGSGTASDVSLTAGTGGIVLNKAGTQTFSGGGGKTITFGSKATVNGGTTLALMRNLIVSGTSVLTVSGTLSGGPGGYVIGSVNKSFAATGAKTFEVGTANGYSPVDVDATGGTFPSNLTVKAVQGQQPNFPNDVKVLQRYWPLTAGANPLTATLTFNYNAFDVPSGANECALVIGKVDGGVITLPGGSVNCTAHTATISNVSSFSDWTLFQPATPTAVKLAGMKATSYADGVMIEWRSGYEVDNLGYNVYRELGGQRTLVNQSLVAGSALQVGAGTELTAGRSYEWFDPQGSVSARYWLEAIDLNGKREIYGPAVPLIGKEDGSQTERRQSLLLSELNNRVAGGEITQGGWPANVARAEGAMSRNLPVLSKKTGELISSSAAGIEQQWQIASRPAVKIQVSRTGWHRVSQAQLVAAGLDPNADPSFLQLYVDGQEQSMRVNGGGGAPGESGSIEFYGTSRQTPTTGVQTYWLVSGTRPGKRIPAAQKGRTSVTDKADALSATQDLPPGVADTLSKGGQDGQSFDYTVELKERQLYFSSLLNGDEENFFGKVISSQPVTQALTARHVAPGDGWDALLEIALQGVSAGRHNISVFFNDVELDKVDFADREPLKAKFTIPGDLVREGDNLVKFTVAGAGADVSLINYVRLTYAHKYTADNDLLRLTTKQKGSLRIDGFTSRRVRVFDVTDPANVLELPVTFDLMKGRNTAVRVQVRGNRELLALTDERLESAAAVVANRPSEWHAPAHAANLLILTHGTLDQSVETLKAQREQQGMSVAVVDVEDLYDEFSYGAHSPQAVKDFLQWTTAHWQEAPAYVLLVGDASLDPKNYTGQGQFDLVPTKLIDTRNMETASDDWLADFDDDGTAEMFVGRLPVRTVAEAGVVVAKIVGFTPEQADNSAVLVSDDPRHGYDFPAANEQVRALLPAGMGVATINRADGTIEDLRSQIVQSVNHGPQVVNFLGHGSVDVWTGDGLLSGADVRTLTNGNRLPLFVMMTCLNGYYQDPVLESLSESLLKAEQGGAVAVWASSGMTVPTEQQTMNRELYRQLFGAPGLTLGEVIGRAKQATPDKDVRRTWILFGDPTLKLR